MKTNVKEEIETHIRLAPLKEAARLKQANKLDEQRRIREYNDRMMSYKC